MSDRDRAHWDARYRSPRYEGSREPLWLLAEYVPPAKERALALDVACGLGQNTLWLAEHGYRALGVDISRVALARAQAEAEARDLTDRVLFAQVDLDRFRPPAGRFDVVLVARFLKRRLLHPLADALKPGGLLIYWTLNWRRALADPETPPQYLLAPGELLRAFAGLETLDHAEESEMSHLVARKPLDKEDEGEHI
jgi:tellurite methyltransferase